MINSKKRQHIFLFAEKCNILNYVIRIPIKNYFKRLYPDSHKMNADPQPGEFVRGVDGLLGGGGLYYVVWTVTKFTQLFNLMSQ
jgi:hypothetical protein